jgi:RHS repeat-associated protein
VSTLNITDTLNSANSQNCAYTYDDLARLASANCGTSIQNQSFTYDPYGNITKTVPYGSQGWSFQSTYSATTTATNWLTLVGTLAPAYDNNGNLTNDTVHNYTWDAAGKMLSVDSTSVTLTYDALGRMVEQNRSGVYKQVVYAPTGGKLALMNGQTLSKAFVPLPAGATAVYTSSGLAYYRHSDWLGSSRLATTPARTKYYDGAYAPFGENYAGSGTTDLDFTGQNQDTVANSYDFLFREYSMVQGRWLSPDPAGLTVANPANPQSWNRYGYVLNIPSALVDPFGLFCMAIIPKAESHDGCGSGGGGGGGGSSGGGWAWGLFGDGGERGGENPPVFFFSGPFDCYTDPLWLVQVCPPGFFGPIGIGGPGKGGGSGGAKPDKPDKPQPTQPPQWPSAETCNGWKWDARMLGVVGAGAFLTGQEYVPLFAGTGAAVYWGFNWYFCK